MQRWQAGMQWLGGSEPSRSGVDVHADAGIRIHRIRTQMASHTGKRMDRMATRIFFAVESAGDMMVDSVAVAIDALHACLQVHIPIMDPPRFDARVGYRSIAVTLNARVAVGLSSQVHEHRAVAGKP